jgi:hypothetical protein
LALAPFDRFLSQFYSLLVLALAPTCFSWEIILPPALAPSSSNLQGFSLRAALAPSLTPAWWGLLFFCVDVFLLLNPYVLRLIA